MGRKKALFNCMSVATFLVVILIVFVQNSFAQSLSIEEGIYQKVFTDRTSEYFYKLTDADKEYLEQFRSDTENKLVELAENRLIYLLSVKEINSSDFDPSKLPSVIYVIEEPEFWKYTVNSPVQNLHGKNAQEINTMYNE